MTVDRGARPVWLFSLDSENFYAAPTVTGGLKAYYQRYTRHAGATVELVHFRDSETLADWRASSLPRFKAAADAALEQGVTPVAGFSMYAWNTAEFLPFARELKQSVPGLLIVAGGPHVQQAENFLFDEAIDCVVLGEGEVSFSEFLDGLDQGNWQAVDGLAFRDESGGAHRNRERPRIIDLDSLPSALDVVPLNDAEGQPLYEAVIYETSRGCPYKCAFCEWGTGAIGTRFKQFSLARVRGDFERITQAGISHIWLSDSNFGALKDDLEKARIICELKQRTGLPVSFATSWSKKHSPKVQEMVLMLHAHRLLPHYQLALQTLTPLALELSHRQNMAANDYRPIAQRMAAAGVPIAAELIWGLPGDNLADFERNLDELLCVFPKLNIFGHILLPGTEFYARRAEYRIETVPVAGYGKAKGEYVVACHTFSREEGLQGYLLITAQIVLVLGHLLPLSIRFLAFGSGIPASPLLRRVLAALCAEFATDLEDFDPADALSVYAGRARLYRHILQHRELAYSRIAAVLDDWLDIHAAGADLRRAAHAVLQLDAAFCPREGKPHSLELAFDFDARAVATALQAMQVPAYDSFVTGHQDLAIEHPGGACELLREPDGGVWLGGRIADEVDVLPVDIVRVA